LAQTFSPTKKRAEDPARAEGQEKPAEDTSTCSDPHNILQGRCREVYWYYSFLERWEIYFDPDGKVLAKGHQASF
jgi:hypothetical protein